jgi:hypothetical protein
VKDIINDEVVLSRAPEGALALYIASFSEWASEQGYALYSLRQRIRIAAGLVGGSHRRRSDCAASHLGVVPSIFEIAPGGSGFARVIPPR